VAGIKDQEFNRTLSKLKEIDFADSSMLATLFEYKLRDEEEQIEQAYDVVKEYHSVKLDAQNNIRQERKRKALLLKKNQQSL